jgi:hypothetical protein
MSVGFMHVYLVTAASCAVSRGRTFWRVLGCAAQQHPTQLGAFNAGPV